MPVHKYGTINGLTIKQAKFVKRWAEIGDATDAAEEVYDVKDRMNAHSIAGQLRKQPKIQEAIAIAFRKAGLSPDVVADTLLTNIKEGVGNKATAADANRSVEIWGKMTGAFLPVEYEESVKVTLTKLPTKELILELENRQKSVNTLLTELSTLQ